MRGLCETRHPNRVLSLRFLAPLSKQKQEIAVGTQPWETAAPATAATAITAAAATSRSGFSSTISSGRSEKAPTASSSSRASSPQPIAANPLPSRNSSSPKTATVSLPPQFAKSWCFFLSLSPLSFLIF